MYPSSARTTLALLLALGLGACTTLGVEADPERVDFGLVPVGSTEYATVYLINRGPERTAQLATQPVSSPFLPVTTGPLQLPQDVAVAVVVQVHGHEVGRADGVLSVLWEDGQFDLPLTAGLVVQGHDTDRDGYEAPDDCDDGNAAVHPGAAELCDGVDTDCDGDVGPDEVDEDGDGWMLCDGDCDDGDAALSPGADEICDGLDNDCDALVDDDDDDIVGGSTWYDDDDGDGFGDPDDVRQACSQPVGAVEDATDCDDVAAAIHPDAEEVCDGVDNDCDPGTHEDDSADADTWFADDDADGYGDPSNTTTACEQPDGYTDDLTDCDDQDAAVHPSATELCNGYDDDCDTLVDDDDPDVDASSTFYADVDGDGWGDPSAPTSACLQPEGTVADATDCDDGAAGVHPGTTEVCDGVDTNCDPATDEDDSADADTWYADDDGDGYGDPASTTTACALPVGYTSDFTDCDDADAEIHPDATEI